MIPTQFDHCVTMIFPNGQGANMLYEELEEVLDMLVVDYGLQKVMEAQFVVHPIEPGELEQILPLDVFVDMVK